MTNPLEGQNPAAIALVMSSNISLLVGLSNEPLKQLCIGLAVILFAAAAVVWVIKK